MNIYNNITHFKGLNTLRFFAAYLVLMHHSETMKAKNGLPNLENINLFHNGSNAVTFFFVLSGFLITYILLKERKATQTISIKRFYLKRVLRIWPLYFLLVLLGTIIIPFLINLFSINYTMPYTFGEVWYYFLFFFPGLVLFYHGNHLLEALWSIGVEEIFYLVWAPLFKFVKKNILTLLYSVIIAKSILLAIPYFILMPSVYTYIVGILQFEAMAIGGLGAYYIFNTQKKFSFFKIYNRYFQLFFYSLLAVFLIFNTNINLPIWDVIFKTPIISTLFIDFLFLYLIIGVALGSNKFVKKENKILSYLGEISYGIYMYHMIIVSFVILVLKSIHLPIHNVFFQIIYYVIVTLGTLLVSHLSKKYFEDKFLQLKKTLK